MTLVLGMAVMAMVPGYFVLQVAMLRAYDGRWRWAAATPLLLMVPAAAISLVALGQGSNLWPLILILAAPVGCAMLLAVGGVRWWIQG